MQPIIYMVMSDLNASVPESGDIHDSIISQDIILTGHDIGPGQATQLSVISQQGRCSHIQQPRVFLGQVRTTIGWSIVDMASLELLREQGTPVNESEQVTCVSWDMLIVEHGRFQ